MIGAYQCFMQDWELTTRARGARERNQHGSGNQCVMGKVFDQILHAPFEVVILRREAGHGQPNKKEKRRNDLRPFVFDLLKPNVQIMRWQLPDIRDREQYPVVGWGIGRLDSWLEGHRIAESACLHSVRIRDRGCRSDHR